MTQYEKRFYDDIHSIAKSLELIAEDIKKQQVITNNENLEYDYLTIYNHLHKEKNED